MHKNIVPCILYFVLLLLRIALNRCLCSLISFTQSCFLFLSDFDIIASEEFMHLETRSLKYGLQSSLTLFPKLQIKGSFGVYCSCYGVFPLQVIV